MRKDSGIRRMVWLSWTLDSLAEQARESMGLSRSGLYRYALTRLLEQMSILSSKVKQHMDDGQCISLIKEDCGQHENKG